MKIGRLVKKFSIKNAHKECFLRVNIDKKDWFLSEVSNQWNLNV